jgi:dTDP-4-amino-4,6-dideoxygalactose transaminase
MSTVHHTPSPAPVRAQFLPFHVPEITDEDIRAVVETLQSGWLTTGPRVRQFEEDFAALIGSRHALAVNSGTAALHLALEAVGIRNGDEVIVPAMTFAATAEVVVHCGAIPRIVDCHPDTLNVDPDAIERALSPWTKAIIPVHFGGRPCEMTDILDIAARHHLTVVDDAAHALPAAYQDRRVGTIADLTCFSFYATKTITTGEGGMVTTDRDDYASRIAVMRQHGASRDAWKRYTAEGSWYYEIVAAGFKYNLPDLAAALGIQQLKRCDRLWQARRRIAGLYDVGFADLEEVITPPCDEGLQHAWHLYVIQLDLDRLTINRGAVIDLLKREGIGTSVHFIPLHLHPFYRETFGYTPDMLPVASAAYERILSLPIFPGMADADVWDVIVAVHRVVRSHRR